MTTLDDRPAVKPCGCPVACDHQSYAELASGAENLGHVVVMYGDVMREAVRAAVKFGPAAGMNLIVQLVRSVPELAEGLVFSADLPGGDR